MTNNQQYDLYQELEYHKKKLVQSVKELRKTGAEYAKAEHDYKVLLRQECLKLRDKGEAIGMIDKIAYGIPSVAKLRFDRTCKEAIYKANQESINATKLILRLLDNQIAREWGTDMND